MMTHEEFLSVGITHSQQNYLGDVIPPEWQILLSRNQGGHECDNSNWHVAIERLGGEGCNVRVERFTSWFCDWFELLFVKIDTCEFKEALKIEAALKEYPVLDDEDLAMRENKKTNEIWREFDWRERVEYIREHEDCFDFHTFKDLLSCVRGCYFNGCACELLG